MAALRRHGTTLGASALLLAVALGGPAMLSPDQIDVGARIAIYALAGVGLTVLMGYAGQVSLGQGAFVAVAAYTVGVLTVKASVPLGWAILAAIAGSLALAYLVGLPMLRLRGHHLAVATLALAIIVEGVLREAELTGGSVGLSGIPPLSVGGSRVSYEQLFTAAWLVVLVALLLTRNLVASRPGRALGALGADEGAAESVGVPVSAFRLHAFALSGLLGGVAGVLYVLYLQFLSPDAFGVRLSVVLILIVAIGGLRSPFGALVGAVAIELLTQLLDDIGSGGDLPARLPVALNTLVYGLIILLIMRFLPGGLLPALGDLARRRRSA